MGDNRSYQPTKGGAVLTIKDHKTQYLFSPYPFGPKRQAHANGSWAALFRSEILDQLPLDPLVKYYRQGRGRPSKELYATVGALLLQQTFDLTDEQTVEQFSFNLLWHVALGITSTADAEAYLSERTLWTMRQRLLECGLEAKLFEMVTTKLAQVFEVDLSRQRLDSTHIFSNMRHLGRIGLFGATIRRFLVNLKRKHPERYAQLGAELTERYVGKSDGVFSLVKPSEAPQRLVALGQDLLLLVDRFKDDAVVRQMSSYGMLVRFLREQCEIGSDDGVEARVTIKEPKLIQSDSLQNPSDPDATYSGHKGKGYSAQLMESFTAERSEEKPAPNLITYAEVHPAHVSDVHATLPAISATQEAGLGAQQVLADTLYGSDQNVLAAKASGVELVTPVAGGNENALGLPPLGLDAFTIDEHNVVVRCPQGKAPLSTTIKGEETIACFAAATCSICPLLLRCPARWGEQGYTVRVSDKRARLDARRAHQQTPEFRDLYRYRAGIEAGISHFKQLTGARRLRYRGLRMMRYAIKLKAAGINLLRAAAAYAARLAKGLGPEGKLAFRRLERLLGALVEALERMGVFNAGRHGAPGIKDCG